MMETISEALESINTLTGHFIGHNLQSLFAVKTTCWSSLWASRRGKKGNWSYLECGWRWWSWMWSIWLCGWSTTWSLGLTEQLSKTENVQRGAVVCRKMSCQRQESEVRGQTGLTAWTTAATKITTGDNRDMQNIVNFRLFLPLCPAKRFPPDWQFFSAVSKVVENLEFVDAF